MGMPVVVVPSGGIPVTQSTNGYGTPIDVAANGYGTAVTYVASGGLPVVQGGGGPPAFNVPGLPKWSAAVRAMQAGTKNVTILDVGDSTRGGVGQDGTTGSTANNARQGSIATLLAGKLNAAGYRSKSNTLLGLQGVATSSFNAYDSRASFQTPSSWSGNNTSIGKTYLRSTTDTSRFIFAVPDAFDTIEISVINQGTGVANVYIDGGASPVGVINSVTGNTITKSTFTVPLGVHTIELSRASGSFFPLAIRAFDSAQKEISTFCGSYPGGTTAQISDVTAAWSPGAAVSYFAPDLTIIGTGMNDEGVTTDETTFKANYQRIIDRALVTGDVILCTPNPRSGGESLTPSQATISQWINDIATVNGGLLVYDNIARWGGSFATAKALGFMLTDGVHPILAGYSDNAAALLSMITPH